MPPTTVHLFHHTFRRGGGMERYALGLAAGLKEQGHRVVFHARRSDPATAQAMGIEVDSLAVGRFPRKLQDFRYFRRVEGCRPGLEGLELTLTRVRVRDAVICGGTHAAHLRRGRKIAGPFDWLQLWMEREAYRYARRVISHSDLCTEELLRYYHVPPEKIATIYPPVDPRFGPPIQETQRREHRRRFGFPEDKVVLLFPSMGHGRKGLKPICEALRPLGDQIVLAVAGKPAGHRLPFLQSLGYIEDMLPLYQAADFTILGSYYEPFGLVGPESILCGTRLVFEEQIGCLKAIKPEFVFPFSVHEVGSIRRAVTRAIALARQGQHHLPEPAAALRYNPSVPVHVEALLRVVLGAGTARQTARPRFSL